MSGTTDDVDWATETSVDGAPWWGIRKGKDGVGAFFDAFGKAMDVEDFTPLTFAADDNGDVLTVVRLATRSTRDRQARPHAPAPLLPLREREDLVLPGNRGHRADPRPR